MGSDSSLVSINGDQIPIKTRSIKLNNLGNTCYINSCVQALLNSHYSMVFLANLQKDISSHEISMAIKESPLFEMLRILSIFEEHKSADFVFSPKSFVSAFIKQNPCFKLGVQHDAHEFFLNLIESFDNTISEINHELNLEIGKFSSLFCIKSETQSQCLFCAKTLSNVEESLYIYISLNQKQSLTARLRNLSKKEYSSGNSKQFCEECLLKQEFSTQLSYISMPQILLIQLQRFEYDRRTESTRKISDHIPFPSCFSFCGSSYALRTATVHIGKSLNSGHFVAIKRIEEKWVLSSDSVSIALRDVQVDEFFAFGKPGLEASLPSAYLLFYEKT